MVLKQVLLIAVSGSILGVGISLVVARALQSMLFEARAAAPSTLLFAVAAMLLVAVAASLRPAWMAVRTDPMRTLTVDR